VRPRSLPTTSMTHWLRRSAHAAATEPPTGPA
jgi:hypothetical protein